MVMTKFHESVVAYPLFPPAFPAGMSRDYTRCLTHVDIVHMRLSLLCLKYTVEA
jgi:hypothetical protein